MEATLVDTNVIIDFLNDDTEWFEWSSAALSDAADRGVVAINPIIYAEVSVAYGRIEDVEAALPHGFFVRLPVPWAAAFLAGQVFKQYRRRGGKRPGVLPDFFVGAHAAVSGLTLLTRDGRRYRQYFPKLRIIQP
jgi:predicted nucleic acid-binding protein